MTDTYLDSLQYTGTIIVKEFKGKELIKINKFHNQGCDPLFRFFAKCLGGDFASAKLLKPTKIKLFDVINKNSDSPAGFDFSTTSMRNVSTDFIYLDTNVFVQEDKATFRFSIPYSYLIGSFLSVIGLYADSETNDKAPCAYYLLTKEVVQNYNKILEWDPVDIRDKNHNFSLLVEWTMQVSNPEKIKENNVVSSN